MSEQFGPPSVAPLEELPDEDRPDIAEARQWIARRYNTPVADVEREFGFKPGTLRKYVENER